MNHQFRLVWNRHAGMLVPVAEFAHGQGKGKRASVLSGARALVERLSTLKARPLSLALLLAFPAMASAQTASPFLDLGSLDGWTKYGSTTLSSTTDSFNLGGKPFSLTPAASNNMVKIAPAGSSINGAAAADTALGLSAGTVASVLGSQVTNFGILSKSFTFNPGTYSFAWAYAATDYQPYNDGVLFAMSGGGTQSLVSLARNGKSSTDISGPQASTLILGSYGSTAWMTTSFTVDSAGTYKLSYGGYNWNDTGADPTLYISGVAGSFTGAAIVPVGGAPVVPPAPVAPPAPVTITGTTAANASGLGAGTLLPVFDGGTLTLDTSAATYAQNFTISTNGGSIDVNGKDAVISGVVSDSAGAGALNIVNGSTGGSLTLTGVNTYTGATTIGTGATLALSGAGSIAASSGVTNNGVLDLAASTSASLASLNGSGSTVLGSQSLTLTNANGSLTGAISGSGGVTVAGGTLALGGSNSYTGSTSISSGATLALSGAGSLAASSKVVNNGSMLLAGTSAAMLQSLEGAGSVTLAGQSLVLTNAAGSFSGVIDGTGGVSVTGGSETLAGANTFRGAVTVGGGASLLIGSDSNLGNAANAINLEGGTLRTTATLANSRALALTGSGTLATDAATTLALAGNVSGSGMLTKAGSGTLTLSGDNRAATGGVSIEGGTLKAASASALGSGALALKAGTLETTVNLALAQNLALSAATTVRVATGTTTTVSGNVAGAAGSGCVTKAGSGTLNLAGASAMASGLCVQEGELRANGTLSGAQLSINSGATLRGTGSISAPVVVAGTLAPGNSPGTLTSSAAVTLTAGSTFQADINGTGTASGPGNYSRLLLTNGASFSVTGATLAPNLTAITGAGTYTPYVPLLGDQFRIVSAAGGISGRFATLLQPAGLRSETRIAVFYNGNASKSIDLIVLPSSYKATVTSRGGNLNAQAAGGALDRLLSLDQAGNASARQSALSYAVAVSSADRLVDTARSLSGEVHGVMAATAPLAGQSLQGSVARHLDGAIASGKGGVDALWVELGGERSHWDGDDSASGASANRLVLTLGLDALRTDTTRVGFGFTHAKANLGARGGSGKLDQNIGFVYAEQRVGTARFDGLVGIGNSDWTTGRAEPLGASQLRTAAKGKSALASVGVHWAGIAALGDATPYARLSWQRSERDAASEGTALSALDLGAYRANGSRLMTGLSGALHTGTAQGSTRMQYNVGVGVDGGGLVRPGLNASLAGTALEIVAPHVGRAFAQLGVSGSATHGARTTSFYGINGEVRDGRSDLSLSGGLQVRF